MTSVSVYEGRIGADGVPMSAKGWNPVEVCGLEDVIEVAKGPKPWSPILWADGYRKTDNFHWSDFCVIDVDAGLTLPDAQMFLEKIDRQGATMTTRNHQISKGGKLADRFRIIMPWDEGISDYRIYRLNYNLINSEFEGDPATKDGARFFFPSPPGCLVYEHDGIYMIDVDKRVPVPDRSILRRRIAWKHTGTYPPHIHKFIHKGEIFGSGRNNSCFVAAKYLLEIGTSLTETIEAIEASGFDRTDFGAHEIAAAVESAAGGRA